MQKSQPDVLSEMIGYEDAAAHLAPTVVRSSKVSLQMHSVVKEQPAVTTIEGDPSVVYLSNSRSMNDSSIRATFSSYDRNLQKS